MTAPRFSRFTLRTLLVVMAILCAGLAWFGQRLYRAREQAKAVEFCLSGWQSYCAYDYDYYLRDGEWDVYPPTDQRGNPSWLAQKLPWLGTDFFHDLMWFEHRYPAAETYRLPDGYAPSQLDEDRPTISQQNWNRICALRRLVRLETDAGIPDPKLQGLTRLTELRRLELYGGGITAEGWRSVRSLTKLQRVEISNVTGADELCRSLAQCPHLKELKLYVSDLTDEGLAHLKANHALEAVSIFNAPQLQGTGFPSGEEWPALWFLHLSGCPITDNGVVRIADLPDLATLSLDDSEVTDVGICRGVWGSKLRNFRSNNIPLQDAGLKHLATIMVGGEDQQGVRTLIFNGNRYHEELRAKLTWDFRTLSIVETGWGGK